MKTVEDILEDIQQAHVECGGCFVRQKEIADMTVGELLKILTLNNVEFTVKYKRNEIHNI